MPYLKTKICSIGGCDRKSIAKDMCTLHYGRQSHGTPLDKPLRQVEYRKDRRNADGLLVCSNCNKPKPDNEFREGRLQCIKCLNTKSLSYQRSDPLKRRERKLLYKYGITLVQYDRMLESQEGLCAICKKPPTRVMKDGTTMLVVDHDHSCCPNQRSCGKCIRSLLCHDCNSALGFFHDDPGLLKAANDYIRRWSPI